jgi:hypothetical protein
MLWLLHNGRMSCDLFDRVGRWYTHLRGKHFSEPFCTHPPPPTFCVYKCWFFALYSYVGLVPSNFCLYELRRMYLYFEYDEPSSDGAGSAEAK